MESRVGLNNLRDLSRSQSQSCGLERAHHLPILDMGLYVPVKTSGGAVGKRDCSVSESDEVLSNLVMDV